jgi:hypothetical protein
MNAKLCKRLRRWAESETVGMPNVQYRAQEHVKFNPKFNPLNPMSGEPSHIVKIQMHLTNGCTRYAYKQAKRRTRQQTGEMT